MIQADIRRGMSCLLSLCLLALCACGGEKPSGSTAQTAAHSTATPPSTTAPPATGDAAGGDDRSGELTVLWHGAGGTDGKFECTYLDYQSSIPDLIYDTLVKLDMEDNSVIIPRMAESWARSDDGLTYTFRIREGLMWGDGAPVTADDILWSVKAMLGYRGPTNDRGTWSNVEGVDEYYDEAVTGVHAGDGVYKKSSPIDPDTVNISGITADGDTLTVKLKQPWSGFMMFLASFVPYPRHCFADDLDFMFIQEDTYWQKPVHCGPYRIQTVDFPEQCVLVRNEDWYGPAPAIETIRGLSFDSAGSAPAAQEAMINGRLDVAHSNEFNSLEYCRPVLDANPDFKLARFPAPYIRFFMFQMEWAGEDAENASPWTHEPLFRKAVSMAVDREAIAALMPNFTMLTTNVSHQSPLYDHGIPRWTRDVDGARALLDGIGYDGAPLRVMEYFGDDLTGKVVDIVARSLGELGIPVEHYFHDGSRSDIRFDIHPYDMQYVGYSAANQLDVYALLETGTLYDKHLGHADYRAARYNPLLQEYRSTYDAGRIKEIADELQRLQVEDNFVIPLYSIDKLVLYNAAKVRFDAAWERCDSSAIFRDCDLRLEHWRLLSTR